MLRMTWKVGIQGGLCASWQNVESHSGADKQYSPEASTVCTAGHLRLEHNAQACTLPGVRSHAIISRPTTQVSELSSGGTVKGGGVGCALVKSAWKGSTSIFGGLA